MKRLRDASEMHPYPLGNFNGDTNLMPMSSLLISNEKVLLIITFDIAKS